MPKRALIERRPWLLASLVLALAYFLLKDREFPGTYLFILEAGSLFLLAVYAMMRHDGKDGRIVAAIMFFAGIGVVAVELDQYIGILVLILAYALGIGLFVKYRRANMVPTQKVAAVSLLFLTPLICWRLPFDRADSVMLAIYGLSLGAMAATAWASRFPRYRVGAGALLQVFASIVSIATAGPLYAATWPDYVVWSAFYLGHFLVCTGTIQTLRIEFRR